ncbi:MAG TPA: META domain-containing protein [Plantibacter sp.]|uniref:META domain-containing protein n=1 Tax=unclassified Plantibacter TaxID=2624265 RepID=UPI002C04F1A0|nr:META domain-containing protein [Plantibacter sp.]
MMRTVKSAALLGAGIVTAFVLVGCAGSAGNAVLGTWGEGTAATDPHLVFSDDGRVSGSDGCNSLTGSWKADGDAIVVSDVATTLMACPDVDTWLGGIAQATLSESDDQLTVLDESGTQIGSLDRED